MAPHRNTIAKFVIISSIFLPGLWTVLSLEVRSSSVFGTVFKKNIASATTHYGILGQQAPELDLTTWIDGSGNPVEPIHLTHAIPSVMRRYRTGGTPRAVVIDPSGRIVYNGFHIEAADAIALINQLVAEQN